MLKKKEWTLEKFLSLIPLKQEVDEWPRYTWSPEGQAAFRTTFPFILWAGEFNYLDSTESIRVRKWMIPETTLWPTELGGLLIETFRTKKITTGEENK